MVAEVEQEHAQHLLLASTMFSTAVMCGNSSKFWNTMPMRSAAKAQPPGRKLCAETDQAYAKVDENHGRLAAL
jgi:hypothetical protein